MDLSFEKFRNNLRRIRDEGLDPVACYILGCYFANKNEDQFYNLMMNSFNQTQQLQCTEIERIRLLFNISEANFGNFTQEYNSIINRLSNPSPIQNPVIRQPKIIPVSQPRSYPEEVKMQVPPRPQPQIINSNPINISNLHPTNEPDIKISPIPFTASDKPPALDPHRDRPSGSSGPNEVYSGFQSHAYPSSQRPPIIIPPIPQDRNCSLCDSVVHRDTEFSLPCNHRFHRNCIAVIVVSFIESRSYPAKCTVCSSQIPDEYIKQVIEPDKFNVYLISKNVLDSKIRNLCADCGMEYTGSHPCGVNCDHINRGFKSNFGGTAICNCGKVICTECKKELQACICHRSFDRHRN